MAIELLGHIGKLLGDVGNGDTGAPLYSVLHQPLRLLDSVWRLERRQRSTVDDPRHDRIERL
jgi:hypothetical protein